MSVTLDARDAAAEGSTATEVDHASPDGDGRGAGSGTSTQQPPTRPGRIVVCPHLESVEGAWRMATPSRDHRCMALAPPAPQPVERQRHHCLSPDHVECPVFRAARAARHAALAGAADPSTIEAADQWRRPQPRTAPVLLEPPRLVDQVLRLQGDRGPGQILLIGLMLAAFAIVALSRISAVPAEALPSVAPSVPVVPTASSTTRPSASAAPTAVEPSARPSVAPSTPVASAAPSASFRTSYTVKRGDTLIGIANKFNTTVAKLRTANGLKGSTLRIGQVLQIP
jgi:LysM repeat protein